MQNNPEIQAARSRFEAATKRPSQVGTLPEPTASYTNFGVGHPFSRLNGSDFAYQGLGVSQELPFPGKLGLASEQAKREAESEQQNYWSVVLGVTARLKVAWYEWLAVQKAIEFTRKGRDLLGRFEEIARNRYTVGKGLQQDVLKAQFEYSRARFCRATMSRQGRGEDAA
jgi:outer membrane protein, heavy metal efflux system